MTILGTAGHVDHGKTSLVRALTGVDTDRLPEEKRRGISIELGFAPWNIGDERDGPIVSLVDVPGHHKFIHKMIAGSSAIGGLLLVIAADEGVKPQTREHLLAAELLGVRSGVVVITKCDRVDSERVRSVTEESSRFVRGRLWGPGGRPPTIVACSARTGVGLDVVRGAVRELVSHDTDPSRTHVRLAIDRAFHRRGTGLSSTGTLVAGVLRPGDAVRVVGARRTNVAHVRGLEIHGASVVEARAPCRLAIAVGGGIDGAVIERGDVVTDDASLAAAIEADVELLLVAPIEQGAEVLAYAGTARTTGRVSWFGVQTSVPSRLSDSCSPTRLARLRFRDPIVVAGGDRLVLRGAREVSDSGAIVAGATVLDASPPPARGRSGRAHRAVVLEALAKRDATAAFAALVAEAAPRPLARSSFASRFAVSEQEFDHAAAASLLASHVVSVAAGDAWFSHDQLDELVMYAAGRVGAHAIEHPLERGLSLATLRASLSAKVGEAVAVRAIEQACLSRLIAVAGDVVISPRATPTESKPSPELERIAGVLERAGVHGMSEFAVRTAVRTSEDTTRATLAVLRRNHRVVLLGEQWFSSAVVDRVREQALDYMKEKGRLTVAEFKACTGMPRNQAILVLEHLDRSGLTRREGNSRVLTVDSPPSRGEGR